MVFKWLFGLKMFFFWFFFWAGCLCSKFQDYEQKKKIQKNKEIINRRLNNVIPLTSFVGVGFAGILKSYSDKFLSCIGATVVIDGNEVLVLFFIFFALTRVEEFLRRRANDEIRSATAAVEPVFLD